MVTLRRRRSTLLWATVRSPHRAATSAPGGPDAQRWGQQCRTRTNSADPPLERHNLTAQLHRRGEQIAARIEQLRNRFQELTEDSRRGSTADDVATAQAHALKARQCAQQAHLPAVQRHEQAAEAHVRLVVWYERQGDSQRAQTHREAALADRAKASVVRLARDQPRS
jgi:hypothetical protein